MTQQKEYLSKEKYKEVKEELEMLKTKKRKEVAEELEYAKSLGDLSENAEYQEARDEQAKVEDRIARLEYLLKNAEIVSSHSTNTVSIGSEVVLQKKGTSKEQVYTLVGSEEANTGTGKISVKSPIGEAIFGQKKGETITVETPGGKKGFTIKDIK